MRRLALLLLLVALSASACDSGGSEETTTTSGSSTEATVGGGDDGGSSGEDTRTGIEIRCTMWSQGEAQLGTWNAIGEAFAAQDPRVESVTFEFVPFSRYHDVLNVRIAADDVQHCGWLNEDLALDYAEAGALYDMTELYETTDGWNLDEIPEAAWASWQVDGRLYGYPFPQSPWQVFYNEDMFEAAGATTPEEHIAAGTWTWDNLVAEGAAIQAAGETEWGFEWQQGRPYASEAGWSILEPFWPAYGGEPFTDGSCTFASPEFIASMQLFHDMIYDDQVYPPPGVSDPSVWAGTAAMGIYHIGAATNQAKDVTFDYGMAPQPEGPAGWHPAVASNGVAVFANAPDADVAAEFLAFLTHPDNAVELAKLHSSPRPSALSTDLWTTQLDISEDEAQRVIDAVAEGYRFGAPRNWNPIFRESQAVFDREFLQEDADVAAVMANMCAAVEDLLVE